MAQSIDLIPQNQTHQQMNTESLKLTVARSHGRTPQLTEVECPREKGHQAYFGRYGTGIGLG
jgi:hypothetical protein